MNRKILFLLALLLSSTAHSASTPSSRLDSLYSAYHEFVLREFPESATFNGDHRYDDMITDISAAGRARRLAEVQKMLLLAQSVSDDELQAADRINRRLFIFSMSQWISGEAWNGWTMPISQQDGIQIEIPLLASGTRFKTKADSLNYLKRLQKQPENIRITIENMKVGISTGLMPPTVVMQRVVEQVKSIAESPMESLELYSVPMHMTKDAKSPSAQSEFEKQLRSAIIDIQKSFSTLERFLIDEYLPKCRKDVGIWALPNGEQRYRRALKDHTSLDLSPDEVFETGMKEVARIEAAMLALKNKLGSSLSLAEFNESLRHDPRFYYQNKDSLLHGFDVILKSAFAALPKLFEKLPEAPCVTKEMEEFRAAAAPQAYYYSAPDDRSHPAYFYVNTYDLPSRPRYTMTALTLHEAVPGHHLQIALAQEMKSLPWFRREFSVTSFVEGWALYAERLGYDMGLYTDPYQEYGALGFEMWRACRLVVDAGMHSKKWTRQQAIDFMMKYTVNSKKDIESEVDRYIAWPGQACAYKIGQMKILALRAHAEQELGSRFSLPAFHNALLVNGAIPLPLLEQVIEDWIQSKKH